MIETKRLSERVYAAGQIGPDDIATLKAAGFTDIVNNRPDFEGGAEQPTSDAVRAAAEAEGMRYSYVPMTPQTLTPALLEEFHAALAAAGPQGKVLAHCRSGARSTLLWALSEVRYGGREVEAVVAEAAQAGYDLSTARPMLSHYAALHGAARGAG
jgi:sulfide:quinone oxidoreductase